MKIALILLIACFGMVSPGRADVAQTTKTEEKKPAADWGALFQVHYVNRVKAFKAENIAQQNIVLLGDSITEGFEVEQYLPFRRVLNRGIGADVIGNGLKADDKRGVLKRLNSSVFDCATSHVFLMIGINDLGASHSLEQMEAGYRDILQTIKSKAPLVTVHVQSVLPTSGRFAFHNSNVIEFNSRIKKLAEEFGYPYFNLHPLFADDKGELSDELTNDGLHLLPSGYLIWRDALEKHFGWVK